MQDEIDINSYSLTGRGKNLTELERNILVTYVELNLR